MAGNPKLLVILGPTASGKSDLAMALARRVGAEILSADSMQVYAGLDLGTAKPSPAERDEVRHHLIDVVRADEPFTVARFVEMAEQVIAESVHPLILTGGTPLYYKALFEGMFEGPGADESLREALRGKTGQELHDRLKQVDPAAAARLHPNDQRRVIRALEVYELTGRPISEWQTEWSSGGRRHEAVWVGLAWEKEALNRRINARVKAMVAAGWVEEVRELLRTYGDLSPTAAEATGYAELIAHVRGKMSLGDAVEAIKISTRQLARRQMKWFRRFGGVTWMDGSLEKEELVGRAMRQWMGEERG
jgi:tRNA dimethylallyltransferase